MYFFCAFRSMFMGECGVHCAVVDYSLVMFLSKMSLVVFLPFVGRTEILNNLFSRHVNASYLSGVLLFATLRKMYKSTLTLLLTRVVIRRRILCHFLQMSITNSCLPDPPKIHHGFFYLFILRP